MIQNLFPTPIGRYELDRDLTAKELSFLVNQEKRPNMGNETSINCSILFSKELTKLRDFIESKISEYFNTVYKPKHKVNLRITQSWLNYTKQGQFHHKHEHFNSFLSGVFYIQANKLHDKIYFYKNGYQQIKIPTSDWNEWNSDSWWISVGAKDLVLFPSSLTHMVETVIHPEVRISLAFNAFPVGYIGDDLHLTGLHLGESQHENHTSKV